MWTQDEAIALCRKVEAFAPKYGAHVALTGGTLYKYGVRKDCDILFYCIRQWDEINQDALLERMAKEGFVIGAQKGWVRKAEWNGKPIDLFFPEAYPAGDDDEYGRFIDGDVQFGEYLP